MEDELGAKIMIEFAGLIPQIYTSLTDDNDEKEAQKCVIKQCVIKRKLKFQDYKNLSENKSTWKRNKTSRKKKLIQINIRTKRNITYFLKKLTIIIKKYIQSIQYKHLHLERVKTQYLKNKNMIKQYKNDQI